MEPLLEINHINYAYHSMQGETPALQNIHFTVCKGDFIAVVGPSGCGKTTLLSLIAGLLLPEEGEILLNGKRLQEQSNNPIGYMLQKDHLLEWRTIWKNIQLGLEIQGNINSASTAYANSLLKNYGLYDFKDKRPCELSGGMRRRVAILRALLADYDFLLLDEPFKGLDKATKDAVMADTKRRICDRTVLFVTHDASELDALGVGQTLSLPAYGRA